MKQGSGLVKLLKAASNLPLVYRTELLINRVLLTPLLFMEDVLFQNEPLLSRPSVEGSRLKRRYFAVHG